jgi:hypothetical protein
VRNNFGGGGNESRSCESSLQPVIPPAPLTGDVGRDCGDASRALLFLWQKQSAVYEPLWLVPLQRKSGAPQSAPDFFNATAAQLAATRGVRLRELRWKNSAWLATAETIAGWNGFEIRNAGSGRSPVRKRSG